jgi:phospholipid/cholesterol/gamma-HCH transport system substrate-binding protein
MAYRIEFKVGLFILITTLLIMASIGYVAYKKGVFSKVYTYTLSSKTGENITAGTPVVYLGFNIGRVSSMELTGNRVLIKIEIPERHNCVIRADSRFVLEKPLFGTSRIIVYTDNLEGPPLPETTILQVIVPKDIEELIKMVQTIVEKMDKIAGNMATMTEELSAPLAKIDNILENTDKVTSLMAEKKSLLEILLGDQESVKSIQETIDIAKEIIEKIDKLAVKTDERIYGDKGVFVILQNILTDLTAKLAKIEVTLDNINKVSTETANATGNLESLRNDLDETITSVRTLIDDLDNLIPFKDDKEIGLP